MHHARQPMPRRDSGGAPRRGVAPHPSDAYGRAAGAGAHQAHHVAYGSAPPPHTAAAHQYVQHEQPRAPPSYAPAVVPEAATTPPPHGHVVYTAPGQSKLEQPKTNLIINYLGEMTSSQLRVGARAFPPRVPLLPQRRRRCRVVLTRATASCFAGPVCQVCDGAPVPRGHRQPHRPDAWVRVCANRVGRGRRKGDGEPQRLPAPAWWSAEAPQGAASAVGGGVVWGAGARRVSRCREQALTCGMLLLPAVALRSRTPRLVPSGVAATRSCPTSSRGLRRSTCAG